MLFLAVSFLALNMTLCDKIDPPNLIHKSINQQIIFRGKASNLLNLTDINFSRYVHPGYNILELTHYIGSFYQLTSFENKLFDPKEDIIYPIVAQKNNDGTVCVAVAYKQKKNEEDALQRYDGLVKFFKILRPGHFLIMYEIQHARFVELGNYLYLAD